MGKQMRFVAVEHVQLEMREIGPQRRRPGMIFGGFSVHRNDFEGYVLSFRGRRLCSAPTYAKAKEAAKEFFALTLPWDGTADDVQIAAASNDGLRQQCGDIRANAERIFRD